jgi:hypothetical protein
VKVTATRLAVEDQAFQTVIAVDNLGVYNTDYAGMRGNIVMSGPTIFGYGLQWSANGLRPNLPVDVVIGFFRQSVDIGTLIATDANSIFVAASKNRPLLTLYGGYAIEDSEMTIADTPTGSTTGVAFTVDDAQRTRLTVGATLNVLAKLNSRWATAI